MSELAFHPLEDTAERRKRLGKAGKGWEGLAGPGWNTLTSLMTFLISIKSTEVKSDPQKEQ